jgi:hypothetical protein
MNWLRGAVALALALPASIAAAGGSNVGHGGLAKLLNPHISLRAGGWTNDRDLNDETLVATGGLRGRLRPSLGKVDGFAEAYVQGDSAHGVRTDVVESWLRLTTGSFELKAGRQIPVWGRADRLNPSDVLSSRDYTLLVASDDEQRRGSAMLQARFGLGLFTLDGWWLPEFRPNVFPLDRRVAGVALLPDERASDQSQFAVKLDRSGGSIDFSVGWFHGTDRTRDFVRAPVPPNSPSGTLTGVQQRFPQVDVFTADAAGTLGRLGWRSEIAWSRYRGLDDVFRKNDNIWLVAGIDSIVAGGININLQYSWRRILDYVDVRLVGDPVTRAVASESAAVNNQLDQVQNGFTLRVARKWAQDTLDTEISAIVFVETGDAAIRPKLVYAINDQLRLAAGADIFIGPRLSYFGRVRSLSGGFVQVTHGF